MKKLLLQSIYSYCPKRTRILYYYELPKITQTVFKNRQNGGLPNLERNAVAAAQTPKITAQQL